MIDYIYVGCFERNGSEVRIDENVRRGLPVVRRVLPWSDIEECLAICGVQLQFDDGVPSFPTGWLAFYKDGFATFDRGELNEQSLCVIGCLVERYDCEIVYPQTASFLPLGYVVQYARKLARRRNGGRNGGGNQ